MHNFRPENFNAGRKEIHQNFFLLHKIFFCLPFQNEAGSTLFVLASTAGSSNSRRLRFHVPIEKSSKLDNVCYDIRGPVLKEAKHFEERRQ